MWINNASSDPLLNEIQFIRFWQCLINNCNITVSKKNIWKKCALFVDRLLCCEQTWNYILSRDQGLKWYLQSIKLHQSLKEDSERASHTYSFGELSIIRISLKVMFEKKNPFLFVNNYVSKLFRTRHCGLWREEELDGQHQAAPHINTYHPSIHIFPVVYELLPIIHP